MKFKIHWFLLLLIQFYFLTGWSQNNLSVSERRAVSFDLSSLIAAGKNSEMIIDDSQWMNYSLNVSTAEPLSSISVSVASGNIPRGIELYMQAGHYTGSGKGKMGRPTGKVKVDYVPKALINEIGTGYTGKGKHLGHQITLSMVITDFSLIQSGDYTLYLQYTLN